MGARHHCLLHGTLLLSLGEDGKKTVWIEVWGLWQREVWVVWTQDGFTPSLASQRCESIPLCLFCFQLSPVLDE